MRHLVTTIFLSLLCSTQGIWAQSSNTSAQPWSLTDCLDYAIANNLQIKSQDLTVEQQRLQLVQSKHSRYPNLNGNVGHNYNWGRSFDVFTNAPVTERVQSNSFSLSSSVVLFDGFRITNTIKQNDVRLEQTEFDLEEQKNTLQINVITGYVTVLFNKENLANAQRLYQNSLNQLERTEKLVKSGVLPQTNLLDLKSQNANDKLQVVQNENALQLSLLQLAQLLQLPQEQIADFDIIIPELPSASTAVIAESVEEVYQTAESSMPEVQSADLGVQSAELGIKIAQANYYPTLTLSGSISTFYSSAQDVQVVGQTPTGEVNTVEIGYVNDPTGRLPVFSDVPQTELQFADFTFADQLDESLRRGFGFNLSIPIYNRHQAKTAVANAQVQREQARVTAAITRNQLRQTVETAYYDVLAAINTYSANQQRVDATQETFRVTEKQYNAGAANITDYQVARNNLSNAQADLIRAKYDLLFRQKILDFYLGRELKF